MVDFGRSRTGVRLRDLITPQLDDGEQLEAWTRAWISRDGRVQLAPRFASPRLRGAHRPAADAVVVRVLHPPAAPRECSTSDSRAARGRRATPAERGRAPAASRSRERRPLLLRAADERRRSADGSPTALDRPHATERRRRELRHRDRRRHHRRARVRRRRATARRARASYREFPQHFPQPGWVEHDADDIWRVTRRDARRGRGARSRERGETVAAIGITNQRETVVVWDRRTGRPRHRAIVWQDRRTAERCDELRAAGHEPLIRRATGLVLDPYFSAIEARVAAARRRRRGRRRPRVRHRRLVDPVAASPAVPTAACTRPTRRTRAARCSSTSARSAWSDELCALFDVPRACLPEVAPSSGRFGTTRPDARGRSRACP